IGDQLIGEVCQSDPSLECLFPDPPIKITAADKTALEMVRIFTDPPAVEIDGGVDNSIENLDLFLEPIIGMNGMPIDFKPPAEEMPELEDIQLDLQPDGRFRIRGKIFDVPTNNDLRINLFGSNVSSDGSQESITPLDTYFVVHGNITDGITVDR